MTKQTKTMIGIAAVVAVGYLFWKRKKNFANAGGFATSSGCPKGQIKCPNSKICYDPKLDYLVDPCGTIASASRQSGGPRFGTPIGPLRPVTSCTVDCVDGRCTADIYGPTGNIISREYHLCTGSGENVQVGPLINPR